MIAVHHADALAYLKTLAESGPRFDACVTDPPYHLQSIVKRFGGANADAEKFANDNPTRAYRSLSRGFMGKTWDGGDVAQDPDTWRLVFDVLKPGAYLVAFAHVRTYHRMACAIEDAGFDIRDQIGWLYGSGFPKSLDISKAIDRASGSERERVRVAAPSNPPNLVGGPSRGGDRPWRQLAEARGFHEVESDTPITDDAKQWDGWGTALKPAWEPICLARKPFVGTVAANVLKHGTGALNVDACRVPTDETIESHGREAHEKEWRPMWGSLPQARAQSLGQTFGRWPANVIHDDSGEVRAHFPDDLGGNAARFFYSAKANESDRLDSKHPTVKPVALMRWLARLVTPPGGTILDPFAGSGTTGAAAMAEGFDACLIERDEATVADIHRRIAHADGSDAPLFAHADLFGKVAP